MRERGKGGAVPPKAGANLFLYWIRPVSGFLFGWSKTSTILSPERGKNNEFCPIMTGKKRGGNMVKLARSEIHRQRREMTEKAKKILQKTDKRQALRRWREFSNPDLREEILSEFNRSTLDPVAPLESLDKSMRVLSEMNDLQMFENDNWNRGN